MHRLRSSYALFGVFALVSAVFLWVFYSEDRVEITQTTARQATSLSPKETPIHEQGNSRIDSNKKENMAEAKPLAASDLAVIDKELDHVKSLLNDIERSNLEVIDEIDDASLHRVVAFLTPPSSAQMDSVYTAASASMHQFDANSPAGDERRSRIDKLLPSYTDYPLPFKVLVVRVDKKTGKGYLSESIAPSKESVTFHADGVVGISTPGGGRGRHFPAWGESGSEGTRRYGHLFQKE